MLFSFATKTPKRLTNKTYLLFIYLHELPQYCDASWGGGDGGLQAGYLGAN